MLQCKRPPDEEEKPEYYSLEEEIKMFGQKIG